MGVVEGSPEDVVERFKNFNQETRGNFYWNTEGTLRVWYASLGLNMKFFKPIAFVVYDADDASTQRFGNLIPSPSDPIVAVRMHPKYPNEYHQVRQNFWPQPELLPDLPPPDNRSVWRGRIWGPDALMEWTPNKVNRARDKKLREKRIKEEQERLRNATGVGLK